MKNLLILACLAMLPTASSARAEETVWVHQSTSTLTVSEVGGGWLVSNGKARSHVRDGDRLPSIFQTQRGKVLRAGHGPRR